MRADDVDLDKGPVRRAPSGLLYQRRLGPQGDALGFRVWPLRGRDSRVSPVGALTLAFGARGVGACVRPPLPSGVTSAG
jgi:hypothetical protein